MPRTAQRQFKFDAFISYNRRDTPFAALLEAAIDNYRTPRLEGKASRRLEAFRDASDLTGADYDRSIEENIAASRKLILICSPNSANAPYVNNEIERFVAVNGAENIIPVIIDGMPRTEAEKFGQPEKNAFPQALCDALVEPLAKEYRGFDPVVDRKKLKKGPWETSWLNIVADMLDISRDELEQRERRRRRRRRWIIGSITSAVAIALITTLAFAWSEAEDRRAAEEQQRRLNLAKIYEEKAGRNLQEQSAPSYQKTWLYSLAALSQGVDVAKLSQPHGWITRSAVSSGAGIDQLLWHSPRQPAPAVAIATAPDRARLAVAEANGVIRIWSLVTGEERMAWTAHDGAIADLAFAGSANGLVSSDGRLARFWHLSADSVRHADSLALPMATATPDTGETLPTIRLTGLPGADHRVIAAWGESLYLLSQERAASPSPPTATRLADGFTGSAPALLAVDPAGAVLAAGDPNGQLRIWHIETDNLRNGITIATPPLAALGFDSSGSQLAGVFRNGTGAILARRDSSGLLQPVPIAGPETAARRGGARIGTAAGKGTLVTVDSLGGLTTWDVAAEMTARPLAPPRSGDAIRLMAAAPGNRLILSAESGRISVMDTRTGALQASSAGHHEAINVVAVHPDRAMRSMATGGDDGQVIIWNTATGVERHRLLLPGNSILALAYGGDGDTLLIGSAYRMTEPGSRRSVRRGAVHRWVPATGFLDSALVGLPGPVWALAQQGGPEVAIGLQDTLINLLMWHSGTGDLDTLARRHTRGVNGVAFLPGGRAMVSGSRDNTLVLWETATGRPILQWAGHQGRIYGVAASPIASLVASSSVDESVRLWDIDAMRRHLVDNAATLAIDLPGRQVIADGTPSRRWSVFNSGRSLVLTPLDGIGRSWFLSGTRANRTVDNPDDLWGSAPGDNIWHIAVNARREVLAYRHVAAGRLAIVELGRAAKILNGHFAEVWNVGFSPDGELLASGSEDQTVRIWSVDAGVELARLDGHDRDIFSVAFAPTPEGLTLATASFDQTVRLWDVNAAARMDHYYSRQDTVRAVAFTPSGEYFAYGGHNKRIYIHRTAEGSDLRGDPLPIPPGLWDWSAIMSVAFSPTGDWIAYGSSDNRIRLWRFTCRDDTCKRQLLGHDGDGLSVAFSPDGRWLASGSSDNRVRLWRRGDDGSFTPREWAVLTNHSDKVRCVRFSPDSSLLASASSDNQVLIWRVSPEQVDTKPLHSLRGHSDGVWSVAFNSTSRMLASASWDGTIRTWDMVTGDKVITLRGHRGPVLDVSYINDSTLVSGGWDGTVRIWNLRLGSERQIYKQHGGPIYSIAVSPDRQLLVSGSADRSLRFLELNDLLPGREALAPGDFRRLLTAYQRLLPFQFSGSVLMDRQVSGYLSPAEGYRFPVPGAFRHLLAPRAAGNEPIVRVLRDPGAATPPAEATAAR